MGVPIAGWIAKKLFGTRNQRMVNRYLAKVAKVNDLEKEIRALTDSELAAKTEEFKKRIAEGESPESMMEDIFAVAREAMDRSVGIRNIFNPELDFDPETLPKEVRPAYEQVLKDIESSEPAAPEGPLLGNSEPVPAWKWVDIPTEIYEAVRELHPISKPPYRARPFDVQIIGSTVLSEGRIAEMKTGEGKTIVAPIACYLACLEDKQVHVVTVNDYLVQRDRDWTFPFFRALGLTVGAIHPHHMQSPPIKKAMYECNVIYGTTSEFGFDYLRDNMKLRVEDQVQKKRQFAIVDEVDSILIDEARTPLIISGPAHSVRPRYELANDLAIHLVDMQKEWTAADDLVQECMVKTSGLEGDIRNSRDKSAIAAMKAELEEARNELPKLEASRDRFQQYFEVELDKKTASVTHEGVTEAQRKSGIGSFYVGDNIDLPHLLEQALRAHVVYQRDRDYMVGPDNQGEMGVIIVDQNTGRKMVGRQWSDGLHQAVEAKEGVPIKDETQTMATITIQNYFKMYERLSGMTGTADTEATEFHEIYGLDVVSIPTNVPVVRQDGNDLMFMSESDKWNTIVDEIGRFSEMGRPVLVGTTSVEKSEMLSKMLTKKLRVPHEVLNAKQHEREADIVLNAGQLGAVMIATNMAGRGTDIKLGKIDRKQLIDHWKKRNICPREVDDSMSDEDILNAAWRNLAKRELGISKQDANAMDPQTARRGLLEKWVVDFAWTDEAKAKKMTEIELENALDASGTCILHQLRFTSSVEEMGGLHIIGTERHESRRIDNQLRGRAGRQGDNGSSRFYLSLEDDLMKMFAGKKTLYIFSKLGLREGDAIEHPMLSRSVEGAQRKVEERNFQIRKNILDYDEPMEFQRQRFYALRQPVLEGIDVKSTIFNYVEDAIEEESFSVLSDEHRARVIAEWVRENLEVDIDPDRITGKDREDLHELIRRDYLDESSSIFFNTANEYLNDDLEREEWDVEGFCQWAKENYNATFDPEEVRNANTRDTIHQLEAAAEDKFSTLDLGPLDRYLVKNFGQQELTRWANNKFATHFEADMLDGIKEPEVASDKILEAATDAYRNREIEYPVDYAIDMTVNAMANNPAQAIQQLCMWAKIRYGLNWAPTALPSSDPNELKKLLIDQARRWDDSRIAERAAEAAAKSSNGTELDEWFKTECSIALTEKEIAEADHDVEAFAHKRINELLRSEVTQFERWVLLQILDTTWKDHLHSMDQIRDAIGFRAFSQKDPRIEFKRESARLFEEFDTNVRDKTTDIVFKGKIAPQPAARQQPTGNAPQQPKPSSMGAAKSSVTAATAMLAEAEAATEMGTETQRRDLEIAEQAGSAPEGSQPTPRKPASRPGVATAPAIGRNEIVTVIDPETGNPEQMKWKKAQPLLKKGWKLGT